MLDQAFLDRLDALKLHMHHPSTGGAGGLRRSKALGSSVEFSDFREYAAGDDIRRVDWNAYARFDRLFLKLFMEEQEAHVHVIVDASRSMLFGEPNKWETAVKLAQTISYLALAGNDRVTLYALQGEKFTATRPLAGRQGYLAATEFLEGISIGKATALSASVPRLPIAKGRGMSILLSDFLSRDGYEVALSSLQYRKQEVTALQILSEQERNPLMEDAVRLVDSETGEALEILAGYDTMRRYRNVVEEFIESLRKYCYQSSMGYALLNTEADFENIMLRELMRAGLLS